MQNSIEGATVYITYLQLGYILHADVLKYFFFFIQKQCKTPVLKSLEECMIRVETHE